MDALPKYAEVVNAFLGAGDILSAKELVSQHYAVFISRKSSIYLCNLQDNYQGDTRALEVLEDCALLMKRCRDTNIHVAFAEEFKRLKPVPISEEAVAALAPVWGSREQVERLAMRRPELLPEISQAMVGGVLVAEILAAPYTAAHFATPESRLLLLHAALLLIDDRLDAKMWAHATLLLADTLLEPDDASTEAVRVAEARSALEMLFHKLSTHPRFVVVREPFLSGTIQRLNQLEAASGEVPSHPPDFATRPRRGTAVFLRPLLDQEVPKLFNRFRSPGDLAIRFAKEPATMSLDSALHRVLAYHVTFITIGGRPEGVGSPRFFTPGGNRWQDIARFMIEEAHVIFLYPAASEGVRWELETINQLGMIAKVVLVLPPGSPGTPPTDAWRATTQLLLGFGITLPAASDEGVLCRLNSQGGVLNSTSFDAVWNDRLFEWIEPLLPLETARLPGSAYARVTT